MMIDRDGYHNIRTEFHKDYRNWMADNARLRYGHKYDPKRLKLGRILQSKEPIHALNSRMRTEEEVQDLLIDVCKRVNKLAAQRKGKEY